MGGQQKSWRTRFFEYRKTHPLGYRLLGYIILFSSALALVATAVQLQSDYNFDVRVLDERLEEIQRGYLQSIANSLWTFDEPQMQIEMQGILSLPDIKSVQIVTAFGERYEAGVNPSNFAGITRTYPLKYQNGKKVTYLGDLVVSASLESVYHRLQAKVFLILATNAVKTFLSAIFILFLFQKLVTKHLGEMAAYARKLDLNSLTQPLILHRKRSPHALPDELDQVTAAINEMRLSLVEGIAERERTEMSLRASQEQLRSIVENSTAVVYLKDLDGHYLMVNPEFERISGVKREAVCGRTDFELFPKEFAEKYRAADLKVIEARRPLKSEESFLQTDGLHTFVSIKFPLQLPNHQIYAVCGISTDITERKRVAEELARQKEAAEAASRTKDHFLAMLSHELRTPLTPVLACIEAMQDEIEALPAKLRPTLEMMRRNVELERHIIDDLLDLTRIGKGKLELHLEAVDIHEAVHDVLDICQREALAHHIRIDLSLNAHENLVRADPTRVRQIVWNLVQNAIKFTPDNGNIAISTANPKRGQLVLQCTDTGIGIDSEFLQHMFDPFQQGSRNPQRPLPGLGLGLAITKALVDAHGGTITATSPGRNEGSTFSITLKTAPKLQPKPVITPETPPVPSLRKTLRILLVEDNEDTRRILRNLLSRRGHSVRDAGDAPSALQAINADHYDLLISDIGLPNISGIDLMHQVRQKSAIKAIAISGYGADGDVQRSKEAGFAAHLTKPLDFKKLEEAIEEIAGRQS